jgi:hypothetical protein
MCFCLDGGRWSIRSTNYRGHRPTLLRIVSAPLSLHTKVGPLPFSTLRSEIGPCGPLVTAFPVSLWSVNSLRSHIFAPLSQRPRTLPPVVRVHSLHSFPLCKAGPVASSLPICGVSQVCVLRLFLSLRFYACTLHLMFEHLRKLRCHGLARTHNWIEVLPSGGHN